MHGVIMKQKILIVEDNTLISKSIETKLKEEMFDTKAVFNGQDAIDQFNSNSFDAVLLDLMLPVKSGEDVLKHVARVKAVLRRSQKSIEKDPKQKYQIANLEVNLNNYEVKKNGQIVDLTLKEFEIFKLLLTHPEQTFSKQLMYRSIWGEEYYYNDNVINVHIRRLREKIEDDPSNPKVIMTMWGFGYKLGVNKQSIE